MLMKDFFWSRQSRSPQGRVQQKAMQVAHTLKDQNKEAIASDVTGSYTGESRTEERPEQDADYLYRSFTLLPPHKLKNTNHAGRGSM